jgi:hypothetical protein
MSRILLILGVMLLGALPARANDFQPIRDKSEFLSLIEGRELRLNLFRISIKLTEDGQIRGSALGWDLSGRWDWQDGYFCRDIDWSGTEIPFNCQLVEAKGDSTIRFTVDKGAGDSASFRLQ